MVLTMFMLVMVMPCLLLMLDPLRFTLLHNLLTNLLRVPNITKNILSVRQFTKDNNVVSEFHPSCCYVKDQLSSQIFLRRTLKDGLYVLDLLDSAPPAALVGERTSVDVWHARLGHPSSNVLGRVQSQYHFGFSSSVSSFCDACHCNKSKRLVFTSSLSTCNHPLELLHSDLWGPSLVTATSGHRYYIHFIDHFSRFMWVFPLHHKSNALSVFILFKSQIEKLLGLPIKQLQTDGGGEFKKFSSFLASNGISHPFSCPHTHAENGIAERKHRHLVETGLTLLARASIPLYYWVNAFETAAFLINHMPTPVLSNISPYEKLSCKTPEYSFLRVFGCACYPNLRPYNKNKLQPRSIRCVFLGYSNMHKGYKCLHQETGRLYISRDVVFVEILIQMLHVSYVE